MNSQKLLQHFLSLLLVFTGAFAEVPAEKIDSILSKMHEQRQFNGAVLAAIGDEVVYQNAFGMAHFEWDVPHTIDTRFRIGSITKQFTAAIILQLVEEGKVDLDGKLTDYLPEYPAEQGDKVTIHHLLNHTSGILNYSGMVNFDDLLRDPYEPKEFLREFSTEELQFEPGSKYVYINSGYNILGVIIEEIEGSPYDKVLQNRLLDPLGLENTGYEHFEKVIPKRATGYNTTPSGYRRALYVDTSIFYAAGMMFSTVGDLHKWTRALHKGKVFKKAATLEKMLTPGKGDYGYGLVISDDFEIEGLKVKRIAHAGGLFGFSSFLAYFPGKELTLAAIDNTSSNSGNVTNILARLYHGLEAEAPKKILVFELVPILDSEGIEAAVLRYRQIRKELSDDFWLGEPQLIQTAQHLMEQDRLEDAITISEINLEYFPESEGSEVILGNAFQKLGRQEEAILHYERVLESNPGHKGALSALETMGITVEAPSVDISEETLDRYLGSYQVAPHHKIEITRNGTQLFARGSGSDLFEIYPKDQTVFYAKIVAVTFDFQVDDSGIVSGMVFKEGGRTIDAKKVE